MHSLHNCISDSSGDVAVTPAASRGCRTPGPQQPTLCKGEGALIDFHTVFLWAEKNRREYLPWNL